jgi:hypothetical protein
MDMSDECSNCGTNFGYEIGWDEPPKGDGHIEVTWNPADEPSFVVGETRHYCSAKCLIQDSEAHPFGGGSDD